MKILVAGGAGFIGSALVRFLIEQTDDEVVNLDALTYAGDLSTVEAVADSPRYAFERVNICDAAALRGVLDAHQPDAVMHLAAESHVDRFIDGPAAFVHTNINGTHTLLDAALHYWRGLDERRQGAFRFHHVSTNEVFGSLGAKAALPNKARTAPTRPIRPAKRRRIIWCAPGTRPTACR